MSSQKKTRPKMQIGPLNGSSEAQAPSPPTLIAGFTSTQHQSQQRELRVDDIRPRSHQPRRTFLPDSIEQLTQSVRTHGILQPLSVHHQSGQYELIAGERRLRAARAAGLAEVPVRIFENLSDSQIQQLAALENLQREDLNPVDEADAVMDILSAELEVPRERLTGRLERWRTLVMRNPHLIDVPEDDKRGIALIERTFPSLSRGSWTSFVANRLPVLRLPEPLISAVRAGELEYTKAVAIKSAAPIFHVMLLEQAHTMSIHELRKAVKESRLTPTDKEDFQKYNAQFNRLRHRLSNANILKLHQDERDYILKLLDEATAVLEGKTKAKKKIPRL
ncbi:nucleoid occlusion protein [Deinococcus xinjiangensis]|uniref:Nucleoid occlusion protein n=1 Tax=Deinococcus xinjiangensis TaxID=457454 RepID=A0ABP9VEF6_9DEIO